MVLKLLRVLSDSVLFRFPSNRAFFSFLSDRVLYMVFSDGIFFEFSVIGSAKGFWVIDSSLELSVLFFWYAGTFLSKDAPTFFVTTDVLFYIIFSKRRSHLTISLTCFNKFWQNWWWKTWRNSCMIKTQNIILKIYVIKFPIYK